ncbi:ABC transporter ATP-binding protein [Millisia brevis]|uniref:ABC transporter ATP-binding protein n=1 Tax=Millisia brevis TaxID=264148 RepID=UPI00082AD3B8|nr:ABC transporter ATP-binding protein [Millisia brevis]
MELIRLAVRFLRPYRTLLVGVLVLQAIATAAALYLPVLNADIIDYGVAVGDTGYIWSTGRWMLAVTLVQVVCSVAGAWCGARAAMAAGRDLRAAILDRVQTFSAREVGRFGAPSLITRNTNDVQQVQLLMMMSTQILVMAPIMCVGAIVMSLRQSLRLSGLLAIGVPLMAISMGVLIVMLTPIFGRMQSRIDGVNQVLREQITGIRVVRAFVREDYEAERFEAANVDLTNVALRAGRLFAVMFPIVMMIANLLIVGVIWFGGHVIDDGGMQIGALTALMSYVMQILMSVMMTSFVAMMAPRAAVCAQRIDEVLSTRPTVTAPEHPREMTESAGRIVFDDVEFSYHGAERPVLDGISFDAAPGTVTAIIGSTGSGKTTLINLIPRLMDVTAGQVRVGGVDVRELDPAALRSRIGLVPQRAYLFSGTIADNLRYGNPDATDEQLWEALRIAQAEDFVRAMPEGLESPVSQGGTTVSGGQRQRLSIARAIVRRPAIYLFDDAFSALDTTTDAALRAALRPAAADATVIVVAQRIATIIDADRILVLEDGAVVGDGRHAELVESCPVYSEIVESQLSSVGAP